MAGQMGEGGDGSLDDRGIGDLVMGGHGADGDAIAFRLDALEIGDGAQIDEIAGFRQALPKCRQRLATGDDLAVACRTDGFHRVGDRARLVECEIVHLLPPLLCRFGFAGGLNGLPHLVRGRRH